VYFFLGNDYGAKKLFDGTEVYYKKPVTEKEAEKFGKYLVETGFTDGSTKTVQLLKEGDTYQVRMVQRKGVQIDAIYSDLFKEMAKKLSEDVFRKAPVVIHLCDDKLKTTKVIKMTYLTNNVDALEENPNEMTNAEEAVSTVEHTADSYYATTKTYFYNGPEDSKKNRKYLVEGDVLPALSFQNGFIYTVITNEKGIITKGWLIIEDLKPNTIFGYWEIRPKDDVEGYGFPSLSLEADGTATYQSSDDWGYSGTYDFNGNNVVFTGKPYGDNADGTEPLEKFTFNVRENYLIGNSTTFIRR
jgi:hypothetical protein